MILLRLFVKFRSQERDAEYAPLLANAADARSALADELSHKTRAVTLEMSFNCITFIIFTYTLIFLGPAFMMLVAPEADRSRGIGPLLLEGIVTSTFYILCVLRGLLLVGRLCVVQVRDAQARPRAEGISITSLVLQIVVLIVLALLQAFRPHVPTLPSPRMY